MISRIDRVRLARDVSGMDATRVDRITTAVAAGTLLSGMAMALVYSAIESLLNPGTSLIDGYWRGALPWMGIIEGLVVGGATATILTGTLAVATRGGWARRALALASAAVAGFWWLLAVIGAGLSGAACAGCTRPIDPWAYAYSLPVTTFGMLILPAAVIAFLALETRTAR